MIFEEHKHFEKLGEKAGFVVAYFLFTTILYFLLSFSKKLPKNWTYIYIMLIIFLVALIGLVLKRLLK